MTLTLLSHFRLSHFIHTFAPLSHYPPFAFYTCSLALSRFRTFAFYNFPMFDCLSFVCRLSRLPLCSCAVLGRLKFSAMFLRHLVHWPSVDFQVKFYRDRPRGTTPTGALKARGVAKYTVACSNQYRLTCRWVYVAQSVTVV